jgi:excisionase family DNA binding protein
MSDQEPDRINVQPNLKDLITFAEAARLCGFTDRHLRKLASENQLWAVKLGRNWFTTAQAVKEYLAKNRKRGPKPKKSQ